MHENETNQPTVVATNRATGATAQTQNKDTAGATSIDSGTARPTKEHDNLSLLRSPNHPQNNHDDVIHTIVSTSTHGCANRPVQASLSFTLKMNGLLMQLPASRIKTQQASLL